VELTTTGQETIKQAIKTVEQFDLGFFGKLANETSEFNEKLIQLLEK
jgi:DNA-binding MarR family transcriptional regulator